MVVDVSQRSVAPQKEETRSKIWCLRIANIFPSIFERFYQAIA
jgi:hypothetical protein